MKIRHLAAMPLIGIFAAVALLLTGTFSSHRASAQKLAPNHVEGEVLVTFKSGIPAHARLQTMAGIGAQEKRSFDEPGLKLLSLPPALSVDAAIKALSANPTVARVQPNYVYRISLDPNDPRYADGSLWNMKNTGQSGGTNDADIDAAEAWDLHTGSSSVAVAVIDTGVDYNHPDLAANVWTNPGEIPGNGIDDDGNGYRDDVHGFDTFNNDGDPMDDHDHGTHCAGAIGAAGNNGVGVVGVNWNVSIIGVKFLNAQGSGDTAGAIAALDYVHKLKDSGINIAATSNSWGGIPFDQALKDAIERSNSRGILFVAAAGNGNFFGMAQNNDATAHYPSNFDNANIVAVAATDRNDKKASFSNYGLTTVDLGAPGVDILSTTRNNTYKVFSGTSMATPHVAGAVALLKSFDSTISHLGLKSRVMDTGDINNDLVNRTVSGRRLNIDKMLRNVVDPGSPPPAPTNLSATAGDGLVSLSWSASVGATSYNIKSATTNGGPYTTVGTSGGASFTNTGLANGTTYFYVVTAVNTHGESGNSNQASATPQAGGGGGGLTVSVWTTDGFGFSKTSFRFGENVYFWTQVTNSTGAGVGGASVNLQIRTANGKLYVGNGTTDAAGYIIFYAAFRRSDGKGTYVATSTATFNGQTGTGQASITVR